MYRPRSFDPPWSDFFTRPCPYQVKQYTTFPKFTALPRELQLSIWEVAIPDPREFYIVSREIQFSSSEMRREPGHVNPTVSSTRAAIESKEKRYMNSAFPVPGILHACYDSRVAGLKMFSLAFGKTFGFPIYFNFDADLLKFSGFIPLYILIKREALSTENRGRSLGSLDLIQYLRINQPFAVVEQHLSCCKWFKSLKHLMFMEPTPRASQNPATKSGKPRVWLPEDTQKFWSRAKTLGTTRKGSARFYHSSTWLRRTAPKGAATLEPPVVTIGTTTEWANLQCVGYQTKGWIIGREETWGTMDSHDDAAMEV